MARETQHDVLCREEYMHKPNHTFTMSKLTISRKQLLRHAAIKLLGVLKDVPCVLEIQMLTEPNRRSRHKQLSYQHCAACIIFAVCIHQIRRVLIPWYGQFLFDPAFSGLKFAKSSPHFYFEAQILSQPLDWPGACCFAIQPHPILVSQLHRMTKSYVRLTILGADLRAFILLIVRLAQMEYAFTQTAWAFAQVYALVRVLTSKDAKTIYFIYQIVQDNWGKSIIQALLVVYVFQSCIIPAARQPSAVLYATTWAGVAYLVKYSNKYFVLVEMSDVFITYALMIGGLGLLAIVDLADHEVRESRKTIAVGSMQQSRKQSYGVQIQECLQAPQRWKPEAWPASTS